MCLHLQLRRPALLALLALVTFAPGNRVHAVAVSGDRVLFGPIGVSAREAVRINIYGISDPNDFPWDFVVRVYNTRGTLGFERRLTVARGLTASVDVNIGNPDLFPVDRLGRRTLRAEVVGFDGEIVFDPGKPDGTPRKLLAVSKLAALGWRPQIALRRGIADAYRAFLGESAAGRL